MAGLEDFSEHLGFIAQCFALTLTELISQLNFDHASFSFAELNTCHD